MSSAATPTAVTALDEAARYFDLARASNPSPALTRRAFDLAVAAGERQRAFDLATQLAAAGNKEPDVALIRLAQAIDRSDWAAAQAARANLADAGYASVVGPIVDAWMLYGRGERAAALAKARSRRLHRLCPLLYRRTAGAHARRRRSLCRGGSDFMPSCVPARGAGISFLRVGEADARAMAGDKAGARGAADRQRSERGCRPRPVRSRQAHRRAGA